jgi:GT2 family glycosyltransferase
MPERIKFLRESKRRGDASAGAIAEAITPENDTATDYASWIRRYDTITDEDRHAIGEAIGQLVDPPLISVVMPVYETPESYLRAAIDSVRTQLYPHWELCVADDASKSPHIGNVLEEYRAADTRIKVCYRSERGQISEAGNSALALAEGEFTAFLDHDHQLPEHALYMVAAALAETPELDLIFSDEDKIDATGNRYDPHFKSDWNPDLMLSQNMVSHLAVYRRSLVEAIGGFRAGYEGSQDYDLVLRAGARTRPERIHHIPHILYHGRAASGLTAARGEERTYSAENHRRVIADYLEENGIAASVIVSAAPGCHRVRYRLPDPAPLVSLIVPTTGKLDILRTCISGILERTDYEPLELIIVPNNTGERQEVFHYLEELSRAPNVRIVPDGRSGFNFSRVANIGIAQASGELIGLINDDLEVIDPGWLGELVSHAVRPGIGAVGAMLYYPNGHIQHAGVTIGLGGVAGHAHLHRPRGDLGYFGRAAVLQNVSAVTAACLVMPKAVYCEVGPLDEEKLAVAYNDIDLCLRIREKGYRVVWTPHAELYHHESLTRGSDLDPENLQRFNLEIYEMKRRWGATMRRDPYYNPNLSLNLPDFELAFPPRVTKPWR